MTLPTFIVQKNLPMLTNWHEQGHNMAFKMAYLMEASCKTCGKK